MAMKKCKDCGTEVSQSAKVCPKCGKKLKHTGLRVCLGILILFIGIGIIASSGNNVSTTNSTNSQTQSSTTSVVTKENYDKIQKGMSKAEVQTILGEPSSVSESETPRSRDYGIKSFSRGIFTKSNRYILFKRYSLYEKLDSLIKNSKLILLFFLLHSRLNLK